MSKFIALVLLTLPLSLHAANLSPRYEQVRRVALRDPKVHAAYEAADRKLAAKIVQIDPALKGYAPGKPAPAVKPKPVLKPKPTPKPTPAPKIRGMKHKVVQGETFESIAMQYRVGVPTLRQANPGVQPRSLQIGQVLIVPKKNTTPPPAPAKPAPKKQE